MHSGGFKCTLTWALFSFSDSVIYTFHVIHQFISLFKWFIFFALDINGYSVAFVSYRSSFQSRDRTQYLVSGGLSVRKYNAVYKNIYDLYRILLF